MRTRIINSNMPRSFYHHIRHNYHNHNHYLNYMYRQYYYCYSRSIFAGNNVMRCIHTLNNTNNNISHINTCNRCNSSNISDSNTNASSITISHRNTSHVHTNANTNTSNTIRSNDDDSHTNYISNAIDGSHNSGSSTRIPDRNRHSNKPRITISISKPIPNSTTSIATATRVTNDTMLHNDIHATSTSNINAGVWLVSVESVISMIAQLNSNSNVGNSRADGYSDWICKWFEYHVDKNKMNSQWNHDNIIGMAKALQGISIAKSLCNDDNESGSTIGINVLKYWSRFIWVNTIRNQISLAVILKVFACLSPHNSQDSYRTMMRALSHSLQPFMTGKTRRRTELINPQVWLQCFIQLRQIAPIVENDDLCAELLCDLVHVQQLLNMPSQDRPSSGCHSAALQCLEKITIKEQSKLDKFLSTISENSVEIMNADDICKAFASLKSGQLSYHQKSMVGELLLSRLTSCRDRFSAEQISTCFSAMVLNQKPRQTSDILIALTKRLRACNVGDFSPSQTMKIIGGLNGLENIKSTVVNDTLVALLAHIPHGQKVEFRDFAFGLGGLSSMFTTRPVTGLLEWFAEQISLVQYDGLLTSSSHLWSDKARQTFITQLTNALHGIGASDSGKVSVQQLLKYLTQLFGMVYQWKYPLSSSQIVQLFQSLRGMSSEIPRVQEYLAVLAECIHFQHARLTTTDFLSCVASLQGMNLRHPGVAGILTVLGSIHSIDQTTVQLHSSVSQVTSKYWNAKLFLVQSSLRGLQCMEDDVICAGTNGLPLQKIVECCLHSLRSLGATERSDPWLATAVLYGLQGLHFNDQTSNAFIQAFESIEDFIRSFDSDRFDSSTAAETNKMIFQTLVLTCNEASLKRRGFPDSMISDANKYTEISMVRLGEDEKSGIVSCPESNLAEKEIAQMILNSYCASRMKLACGEFLHGFQADIVVRFLDAPDTVINIEIDGPSHHSPTSKRFCQLRDNYLLRTHGIEVIRLSTTASISTKNELLQTLREHRSKRDYATGYPDR